MNDDSSSRTAAPSAPTKTAPWYRSKWFNLAIGLVVTVSCLGFALYAMADGKPIGDVLRDIGAAFKQANYVWGLPIWVLLFLFYWIKAWRWRMLLAPLGSYRTSRLFPPTVIGFAFNNILPAHLGEFVRVFVFSRQSGQPKSAVLTTIAVERIFDVVAILAFLGTGLAFVPNLDPSVRQKAFAFAAVAVCGLLGAAAYLTWPKQFVFLFEWCLDRVPLLPKSVNQKLKDLVETGATGLSSLKSGPLLTGILVTSLIQWAFNGLMIHMSLLSFGIRLSPLVSCVVLGVVAVGVTVPSTPGYFGVIQFCFWVVLQLFVREDQQPAVMAASIFYHMVQWIPVTALGMAYFVRSGLQVSDVEGQAAEQETEADE